ncbi:MAG: hypothetical protein IPM23_15835 [Candidatus Melainabacteria bacterium]|nr:hypothetical protein [Candidatus Melainabacteria bacterium]
MHSEAPLPMRGLLVWKTKSRLLVPGLLHLLSMVDGILWNHQHQRGLPGMSKTRQVRQVDAVSFALAMRA